ncbi:MAG: hypothetical protein BWK76_03190 [Desulfobulbaceae bacterium A2]|nr:MAG: hypothetical protein BWK76_03190 [Desulfobulbaceae bacterium A2]
MSANKNDSRPDGADNCTWVTIELPLAPADALAFCHDIEQLLRLNPYLEIYALQEAPGPFQPGKQYHLHALNEMTGIEHDLDLTLTQLGNDVLSLRYSQGARQALEIRALAPGQDRKQQQAGCRLTLREHYDTSAPSEVLEKEVDRGIVRWGSAIHKHLRGQRRWGWLPGYRTLRRFWLSMPPRHRRIGRLLIWIGVAEFIFFLFILAVFCLETRAAPWNAGG